MTLGSCFWSLLAKDSFKFLYVPENIGQIKISTNDKSIKDLLLNRSLFDLMHLNEIELAKVDLSRFLKLKLLAGSITRCRLISIEHLATYLSFAPFFSSVSYQQMCTSNTSAMDENALQLLKQIESMNWNVVDLVLYTVTENTVLAFFHNYDLGTCCMQNNITFIPNCDQNYQSFIQKDATNLVEVLEQHQHTVEIENNNNSFIQIFQVLDRSTNQRILVWPQTGIVETIISKTNHITLKEFKNSSSNNSPLDDLIDCVACSRHFYANSKVEIFDKNSPCYFQRILIPYGNIIFESFQLTSYSHTLIRQNYSPNLYHQYNLFNSIIENSTNQSHGLLISTEIQNKLNTPEVKKDGHYGENQIHESLMLQENNSGLSMFQKFRVHRYEQEQLPVENRRNATPFPYKLSEQGSNSKNNNIKVCASCHTSNSPEWRRGPDGHKTLCNACGLRYSRFKSKQWNAMTKSTTKQ